MIIKGGSRSGPKQLGRHLLRTDTNGRVEVRELQSPAGDLTEALRDWQCLADGTHGTKGLYHANIDPDARYPMTPEQWQRAVEVLEKKLGLDGQPRAVIFHEKNGREHIHVVWQRTDVDTMTLKSDSHNYRKHEEASRALEREFGHEHVPGKHAERDREKNPDLPKAEINHAEWQQAERSGIDPRDRKELLTKLYEQCDNAAAFRAALKEHGYILAKGDRRDFVIVDAAGEIHSLGRQIDVKAKELREFMADMNPEKLPSVEKAISLQEEALKKEPPRSRFVDTSAPPTPPVSETSSEKHAVTAEERAAIEQAVAARHAEESRRQIAAQENERKQTAAVYDRDNREKLAHFDAVQEAARRRYKREHPEPKRDGIDGLRRKLKEFLKPEAVAKEARERKKAAAEFERGLERKRAEYIAKLQTGKKSDLAELDERHAQQQREHAARKQEELERYLREEEAARRLAAELEEERRRKMEKERTRDGPKRAR